MDDFFGKILQTQGEIEACVMRERCLDGPRFDFGCGEHDRRAMVRRTYSRVDDGRIFSRLYRHYCCVGVKSSRVYYERTTMDESYYGSCSPVILLQKDNQGFDS
jgi:hypothetical protein